MQHIGPSYLSPNILIGTVAVATAAVWGLRSALRGAGRAFWSISALLVAWLLIAAALSWTGFYQGTFSRIPTIPIGLLIPVAAGVLLFRQWPLLRNAIERVPQSWLVTFQVYRVEGLIFLTLYAGGWLPGAFALPAGIGDVLVGLLAPIAGTRGSSGWLRAWNLLGIADLLVAITTGFLTSPSPLQLLAHDHPNELISAFPLALIPVFLVPLSVLLHLASLQRLRRGADTHVRRIENHLDPLAS